MPLRAQGGDPGRNNRLADGFQWYHEAFNRGKRSMALDLRHPEAKDLFYKLVECAPTAAGACPDCSILRPLST